MELDDHVINLAWNIQTSYAPLKSFIHMATQIMLPTYKSCIYVVCICSLLTLAALIRRSVYTVICPFYFGTADECTWVALLTIIFGVFRPISLDMLFIYMWFEPTQGGVCDEFLPHVICSSSPHKNECKAMRSECVSPTMSLYCSLGTNFRISAKLPCSGKSVYLLVAFSLYCHFCCVSKWWSFHYWLSVFEIMLQFQDQLRRGLSESQPAGHTFSTSAWRRGLPNIWFYLMPTWILERRDFW